MKASLKLRENKDPVVRFKLPVSLFDVPFRSGCSIGPPLSQAKDLFFSFGTSFPFGPSFELRYFPTAHKSPVAVRMKAGIGRMGSASDSWFSLYSDVDLSRPDQSTIWLKFSPRAGDLSFGRFSHSAAAPGISKAAPPSTVAAAADSAGTVRPAVRASLSQSADLGADSSGSTSIGQARNTPPRLASCSRDSDTASQYVVVAEQAGTVHGLNSSPPELQHPPAAVAAPETSQGPAQPAGPRVSGKGKKGSPSWLAGCLGSHANNWGLGSQPVFGQGWAVGVNSNLPLGRQANLSARWRLCLPEIRDGSPLPFGGLPLLVLDKLSLRLLGASEAGPPSELHSEHGAVGGALRALGGAHRGTGSAPSFSFENSIDPMREVARLGDEIRGLKADNFFLGQRVDSLSAEVASGGVSSIPGASAGQLTSGAQNQSSAKEEKGNGKGGGSIAQKKGGSGDGPSDRISPSTARKPGSKVEGSATGAGTYLSAGSKRAQAGDIWGEDGSVGTSSSGHPQTGPSDDISEQLRKAILTATAGP